MSYEKNKKYTATNTSIQKLKNEFRKPKSKCTKNR
jgi:hypothetical protein